ncbi:MAG: GGDEF domain-containing protein [Patescibacteria group bacterium]
MFKKSLLENKNNKENNDFINIEGYRSPIDKSSTDTHLLSMETGLAKYDALINNPRIPEDLRSELKKIAVELGGNINSLKQEVDEIYKIAHIDKTTGLPNRRALEQFLAREQAMTDRSGHQYAILSFDLDGFKKLNDTYGHAAGDECLVLLARKIQERLRETDILAREGGDEFTILLPNTNKEYAQDIISKIVVDVMRDVTAELRSKYESINTPTSAQQNNINITASIGVSEGRLKINPQQLLVETDFARYMVKALGKDGALTYKEAKDFDKNNEYFEKFKLGIPLEK